MRKIRVPLPGESSTLPANERTTPRATFRRGQLSLQSNEIFGRTNPIPERSRRRANCAQAFVAGPAVFPLYFRRAVSTRAGSERNCANKGREHPAVPVHDRSRLRGLPQQTDVAGYRVIGNERQEPIRFATPDRRTLCRA